MFRKATIILTFLNLISSKDQACEGCPGPLTLKDAIRNSDLVITAKVLSKQIVESFETVEVSNSKDSVKPVTTFQYKETLYKIAVVKKFKGGIKTDTLYVLTGLSSSDCGYQFKVGEKYIIYARKKIHGDGIFKYNDFPPNTFTTSICTRTKPYDPKEIDEIKKELKS